VRQHGIIIKLRFFALLSLVFYTNLSLALGLGDVNLKSNLGEKLFVTVDVSDLDARPDSGCFSASDTGDVPAFKKTNISLKPNGNNLLLTITSSNVITEPIVNLHVSFNCEPNVNREYVLLLDPAPISSIEKATANDEALNSESNNSNTDKVKKQKHQTVSKELQNQADAIVSEKPIFKNKIKTKKSNAVTSVAEKLSEAYTGKQNPSVATESNTVTENKPASISTDHQASQDKPFLVISGNASSSERANKPSLSLRLATEIDFSRPEAAITPPASTDTMDEVTVMTNRLAHLEKQITSLQTRNAQLVADATKAKEEKEEFNWLKIIAIGLGIILALTGAELLRRKFTKKPTDFTETWFDADKSASISNDSSIFPHTTFNRVETQTPETPSGSKLGINEPRSQNIGQTNTETLASFEKEDHSGILDDADVFIEHGRPALAIQLLQNHLSESPAESPAIWLRLLNLLAKEATETEYDEAVVECNKHFNIKAAKFGSAVFQNNSSIEDYPHIITRLEGVWGSPYVTGFLNDLIHNKRSQPREGLDQGAFDDLFFLQYIAKRLESSNPYSQKINSGQADKPESTLANTDFNDALFTDIEPIKGVKNEVNTAIDSIQFDSNKSELLAAETKASKPLTEKVSISSESFNIENSLYPSDSSYEISMISSDEASAYATNITGLDLAPEIKKNQINDSFRAQEINFMPPVEKDEYAPKKDSSLLNEEIVLEGKKSISTDKNIELEFYLDKPAEGILADKVKTKSKAKPSAPKKVESNEIEWDLPEISPKLYKE
jgi:hypothetical protein